MLWSKLKTNVESLFAENVRGIVELRSVSYNHSHDNHGRGYITVYGKEVWNMCTFQYFPIEKAQIDVNLELYAENARSAQLDAVNELDMEGVYSQSGFYFLLHEYCSMPIHESLNSNIPLIKSLAILDRRVGKRKLSTLNLAMDHEMVKYFYTLRCSLEKINKAIEDIT